jgi:predicted nuclease with TOPRIM domain
MMKYNCFAGIAFLLISAIGCEKQSEIQETTDLPTPPAKTAEESAKVAKEEFHKNMEDRLKKLDMEISKLREKGRELKGEAQTEWDKKMAALETKRDAARAKLTEVSHATADAWKDLQKHAQATWDDLEKAFQEASR